MKKLILLTATLLIFQFSFSQWEWQNPLPQGNTLNALSVIDDNIWAVGSNGTISYSSNAGESWEIQNSNITEHLNDVCFVDTKYGWAISERRSIIYTIDGGTTWSLSDKTRLPGAFTSIFMLDRLTGWITGWAAALPGEPVIMHTNDGGITWEYQHYSYDSDYGDYTVFFIEQNEGWIELDDKIIHTSDGGENWTLQKDSFNSILNDIYFQDSERGWAVGENGLVLITTNGGDTWEVSPETSMWYMNIKCIIFNDNNTGWCGGFADDSEDKTGQIFNTMDGGISWEVNDLLINPVFDLKNNEDQIIYAVGSHGEILKNQTNSKNQWIKLSSRFTSCNFTDVFFTDAQHGWASGRIQPSIYLLPTPALYFTNNGGVDWILQEVPFGGPGSCDKIFFTNVDHGWVTSFHQTLFSVKLFHTQDGGETWEEQLNSYNGISDFFFSNNNRGWIIGENGTIQKTEDGGWSWTDQESGTDRNLNSIIFIDDKTGWIAGDSVILHTSNGGDTWQKQQVSQSTWWKDIYFTDELHGWIVSPGWGYGSGVNMRTTDGGENWEELDGYGLKEVFFIDENNGWAKGRTDPGGGASDPPVSNMYTTNDGGVAWNLQPMHNLIHGGFCFIDKNEGWAVGNDGTIMHTKNGGVSGVIDTHSNIESLSIRTYPNPFSTSTTIEYELKKPENIRITIYNQFGKLVDVIEKSQQKGLNKVVWNLENLPIGIYYFRIRAGKQYASGKLIKVE